MHMLHIFTWTKVCFAQVCVFVLFFQAQRSCVCEQHQHQTGSSVVPRPCAVVWLLKRMISSTTIEKCIVCSNLTYEDTNTEMVSHFYTLFNFEKISLEFNLRGLSLIFSNIMTRTGGKKVIYIISISGTILLIL